MSTRRLSVLHVPKSSANTTKWADSDSSWTRQLANKVWTHSRKVASISSVSVHSLEHHATARTRANSSPTTIAFLKNILPANLLSANGIPQLFKTWTKMKIWTIESPMPRVRRCSIYRPKSRSTRSNSQMNRFRSENRASESEERRALQPQQKQWWRRAFIFLVQPTSKRVIKWSRLHSLQATSKQSQLLMTLSWTSQWWARPETQFHRHCSRPSVPLQFLSHHNLPPS